MRGGVGVDDVECSRDDDGEGKGEGDGRGDEGVEEVGNWEKPAGIPNRT